MSLHGHALFIVQRPHGPQTQLQPAFQQLCNELRIPPVVWACVHARRTCCQAGTAALGPCRGSCPPLHMHELASPSGPWDLAQACFALCELSLATGSLGIMLPDNSAWGHPTGASIGENLRTACFQSEWLWLRSPDLSPSCLQSPPRTTTARSGRAGRVHTAKHSTPLSRWRTCSSTCCPFVPRHCCWRQRRPWHPQRPGRLASACSARCRSQPQSRWGCADVCGCDWCEPQISGGAPVACEGQPNPARPCPTRLRLRLRLTTKPRWPT